jgi:hypothetical protein
MRLQMSKIQLCLLAGSARRVLPSLLRFLATQMDKVDDGLHSGESG